MMRRLKLSFYIVASSYAALSLILILMIGEFDRETVGMWGLLLGFILLFAALPFHRIVYFGGRGLMGGQSPEIPGDEHLHQKVHKQYEKTQTGRLRGSNQLKDVMTIAGTSILFIAFFLV